ncbi:alpha/beta fold hydrolase [Spirosoma arcticum]
MTEADDVLFFDYEGNRLAYHKVGHGPATLVGFHGFGQTGHVFYPLNETAGHRFTIFAIDLFFHGDSRYTSNQLLTKTGWQRLMAAFLEAHRIGRFSLIGFSLGGRFALSTVEAFADRLDQLILIAPDGITHNVWYRLATTTSAGRWLFRHGLRHLSALDQLGHALVWAGLLNRTAMRFAELSLSTSTQRTLVYRVWTQFRLIYPDLDVASASLTKHSVRVRFFTGAFDRIVPGAFILPLTDQLQRYELTVLKTGHNHLIELMANELGG